MCPPLNLSLCIVGSQAGGGAYVSNNYNNLTKTAPHQPLVFHCTQSFRLSDIVEPIMVIENHYDSRIYLLYQYPCGFQFQQLSLLPLCF